MLWSLILFSSFTHGYVQTCKVGTLIAVCVTDFIGLLDGLI